MNMDMMNQTQNNPNMPMGKPNQPAMPFGKQEPSAMPMGKQDQSAMPFGKQDQSAMPFGRQDQPAMPMGQPGQPFPSFGQPSQPSMPSMPSQPPMPGVPFLPSPGGPSFNLPEQGALVREGPPPLFNAEYIPGFLARNIGKFVRAEFILGDNQYTDKTGRLVAVGVNYFVLQDNVTRAMIMCDLYSVRFVTML